MPRQAVSTQFARHALIRRNEESGGESVDGETLNLHAGMSPPGFSVLPDWARHWWFGTDVTWRNGGGLLGFGL